MGRAGYSDDYDFDNWSHIRWRGQVASSIKGKRGQAFLRDLLAALDDMPEKRLVPNVLIDGNNVCAIGSLGVKRGVDMSNLDPDDPAPIANVFGIAEPLVREIEYMNDEVGWDWKNAKPETPEHRWQRMRDYIASLIKAD